MAPVAGRISHLFRAKKTIAVRKRRITLDDFIQEEAQPLCGMLIGGAICTILMMAGILPH